jgi:sigma-54 specific flagellar transcriptional regulator A
MTILAPGDTVTPEDLPAKFRQPPPAPLAPPGRTQPTAYSIPDLPGSQPQLAGGEEGLSMGERLLIRFPEQPPAMASAVAAPTSPQTESGLASPPLPDSATLNDLVGGYEESLILDALARCGGVKSRAARALGIKRTTLVEKMKKRGIAFVKP